MPVLFSLFWLIRRRQPGTGPALAVAGACLFIAADPTGLIVHSIINVPVLADVLRRYNLVAGIVFSAAAIAAAAVDDFVTARVEREARPKWVVVCWAGAVLIWSGVLIHGSNAQNFLSGATSVLYSAVFLGLFAAGLCLFRAGRHAVVAVCLLAAVGLEYKAFGTNRRFNAVSGNVDDWSRKDARLGGYSMNGLEDEVYFRLLRHPEYRLAIHEGPHPTDLRHYNLATPQGFDPLLSARYKAAVEAFQPFKTNRLFEVDPFNDAMLQQFAVRWIMTRQGSDMHRALLEDQRYRLMAPGGSHYVVFEYLDARPAWRFDGVVRMLAWEPEVRRFSVESPHEGTFVLIEQSFPGWHATIDGRKVTNERAHQAFQAVRVPAGAHEVEFRYNPVSLRIGAITSLATALCLLIGLLVPERMFRRARTAGVVQLRMS